MILSSPESLRILEQALSRENETASFYTDCLKKAGNPGAVSILKDLVNDENRHAEIVARLIEEARKESPAPVRKTPDTDTAKTRLDRALSGRAMKDAGFSPKSADIQGMLTKALEIEKESFTLYSRAYEEAQENEVKAVYLYLVKEENKHYVMIDNLIDYLDDPGRWLYEEENLIFRL